MVQTGLTLLMAFLSRPFFHLNFSDASAEGSGFSALYRMILDIVPSNLFTPFARGNTLQILFIAIVVGITMIQLGEKSGLVASVAEQLSFIVNSIMGFIGKLVPYFVFGSLFTIIVDSDFSLIRDSGKYFFGTLAGGALILAAHTVFSCLHCRLSPAVLWKRAFSTCLIGLTTASTAAAFAGNLKTCTEKHGVSQKLANFAVPFGQILYKPGLAGMFWFAVISVAEQSGIAVSVPWFITAVFLSSVLASAIPPVPGGTTATFSILFSQLGLPAESLALILALGVIQDFIFTSVHIFAGQCVLLDASMDFDMNRLFHRK